MADNNLAVNIEVAVKNKTDLDLTASKIRNLQRDIKKLADEGNKDPLAIPKLKAANAELLKLNKTVVDLQKTMHRGKEEAEGFGESILHAAHGNRGINRLFREFGNLSGGIENTSVILGRFVGGFAGGLAALAAFKGFEFLRDTLNETSKALGELKKAAGEIGIKPIALQAAQEVVTGIGEEADIATKAMQGMSAQIDEIRKKSTQPSGAGGVSVFRGGTGTGIAGVPGAPGVQVFRGGQAPPSDFGKPLEMLGVAGQLAALPNSKIGQLQSYIIQLKAFQAQAKNFDATQLNILSKTLFGGVPADSMLKVAPALLKQWEAQIKDLENASRGATEQQLAEDEALRQSKDKLSKSYAEAVASLASTVRPAQITINELMGQFFDESAFSANLADASTKWQIFWTNLVDVATASAARIKSAISAVSAGLATPGSNIAEPFGGGISGAIGGAVPADYSSDTGGFASGGFVRGPGSGTSDSILARLSAGEFVVNSAAVRRLGTSFLSGLNGFADGGLVGVPRFAAGGLVAAAGGGTPVHLHLDGQSFATSATESVAGALVVAARRQQMRSAGVKPSWFGGRAGGH
jgi:hypothetical protein